VFEEQTGQSVYSSYSNLMLPSVLNIFECKTLIAEFKRISLSYTFVEATILKSFKIISVGSLAIIAPN
jgi:hypothetical protein